MEVEGRDCAGLERAAEVLAGRRIAVLTGAGVSTDSGLPDYRGEGSPVRHPMTIAQFRSSEAARQRYWAGSQRGWRRFGAARPNAAHRMLAAWGGRGIVSGIATQNVDGLHAAAGSRRVVPLHGTMHRVVCLACGQVFAREAVAERIRRENPWFEEDSPALAPDGDADVGDVSRFVVPRCSVCGGVLKPEVVFFGEFIPRSVFRLAASLVSASEALLVVGSSLVVNSGIRVLEKARRRGVPVVIVNRGATRGDARAVVKLDAGAAQTLTALDALWAARGTARRARLDRRTPDDETRARAARPDGLEPGAAHPRLERHPAERGRAGAGPEHEQAPRRPALGRDVRQSSLARLGDGADHL